MLYLDQDGEPFTGWVREDFESKKIKSIGYLLKGQKTGLWIDWHENGVEKTRDSLEKDSLEGKFLSWHPDGNPHELGKPMMEKLMENGWNTIQMVNLVGRIHKHSGQTGIHPSVVTQWNPMSCF